MTFFKQKTRSKFDSTPEFAAKRLPAHPVSRYSTFSPMWKATRKRAGYVPWPKNNNDDLFPCCHTCQAIAKPESATKPLWYKTANVGWLRAEWFWDFGHLLPAGFISYGVGVTPPPLRPERERIFVFKPDISRAYLDLDMEEHAQCKGDQHEARMRIVTSLGQTVTFPGEIIATTSGLILIALPRKTLFGKGITIFERYAFEIVEMPFSLPILTDGGNIVREGDKILLNGVELN
jgi:hypothetical protein